MNSHIQILGTHPASAPPQLLLVNHEDRFLINAGENTQRVALENRVRLARVADIFITHISPATVGGLPGLLLTLEMADCLNPDFQIEGSRHPGAWHPFSIGIDGARAFRRAQNVGSAAPSRTVRVWGPPPLFDTLSYAEGAFASLRMLSLEIIEITNSNWTAPVLLPIRSTESGPGGKKKKCRRDEETRMTFKFRRVMEDADGQRDSTASKSLRESDHNSLPRPPSDDTCAEPPQKRLRIFERSSSQGSLEIFCATAAVAGTLDVEKAKSLGVPVGPLMGKLKNGNDVTLENGAVVLSSDVTAPPRPPFTFIVGINHPEEGALVPPGGPKDVYVGYFLMKCPKSSSDGLARQMVWHVAERDVDLALRTSPIRAAQKLLLLRQLILGPIFSLDGTAASLESSLERKLERTPGEEDEDDKSNEDGSGDEETTANQVLVARGETVSLYPLNKLIFSKKGVSLDTSSQGKPAAISSRMLTKLIARQEEIRAIRSSLDISKSLDKNAPTVTLLGTGSAMPCKHRNVSGILVSIPHCCEMLLDCGEGSLSQLRRYSSDQTAYQVRLANLKYAFISHLHADHFLGLGSVNKERKDHGWGPLRVLGPTGTEWLSRWESKHDLCGYETCRIWFHDQVPPDIIVRVCRVRHFGDGTEPCFGIRVETLKGDDRGAKLSCPKEEWGPSDSNPLLETDAAGKSGAATGPDEVGTVPVGAGPAEYYSICYSGDTRPCTNMVTLSRGSDLLIHEGTFEPGEEAEAVRKRHSTISEAMDIARQAGVGSLLITHFSQRYPISGKLPEEHEYLPKTLLGYDGFHLPLGAMLHAGVERVVSRFRAMEKFVESVRDPEENGADCAKIPSEGGH